MSESKPEKLPPMRERVALGTAIGELYPQVQQGRNARQRSIAEKLPQPSVQRFRDVAKFRRDDHP
jgi:hypothetical protein